MYKLSLLIYVLFYLRVWTNCTERVLSSVSSDRLSLCSATTTTTTLRLLRTVLYNAFYSYLCRCYWNGILGQSTCRANKNNIIEDGDRDQVLQSIKDPSCKAWKMKLNRRKMVDPTSILDKAPIGPKTASKLVSMKPEEMFEMLEEEIARKTPEQVQHIKNTIKNLCKSQVLAHRHASNLADYLAELMDMISLPQPSK